MWLIYEIELIIKYILGILEAFRGFIDCEYVQKEIIFVFYIEFLSFLIFLVSFDPLYCITFE